MEMAKGSPEYIDPMLLLPSLRQFAHRVSAAIPSQCAVCHAWPNQPICEHCVMQFAQPEPRCQTCALTLQSGAAGMPCCGACITSPPALDACLTAVSYTYPWSGLVGRFKFNNSPGLATQFARVMRSTPWVEPALEATDLVLPMPLSTRRLRQRGYNQALLLARALDTGKLKLGVLLRIKDTPAQSLLDRAQRLRAVGDAFAVEPLLGSQLRGRRVVLVDDVMTSGSTLNAAAGTLRAAGASHVTGLVFARTENE
jgi:ComF family protein